MKKKILALAVLCAFLYSKEGPLSLAILKNNYIVKGCFQIVEPRVDFSSQYIRGYIHGRSSGFVSALRIKEGKKYKKVIDAHSMCIVFLDRYVKSGVIRKFDDIWPLFDTAIDIETATINGVNYVELTNSKQKKK